MAGTFSPDSCRDALVTVLGAVEGVVPAQVYAHRRVLRTEPEIRALFGSPINAWQVSFAPSGAIGVDRDPGFAGIGQRGGGRVLTTFRFQIEGYLGLDDASHSEEAFDTLIWRVVDHINGYGLLPGLPGAVMQSPCEAERVGYVSLANLVLTHYVQLGIALTGQTQP